MHMGHHIMSTKRNLLDEGIVRHLRMLLDSEMNFHPEEAMVAVASIVRFRS